MKKVLITGAAGELGQALTTCLLSLDIDSITCLDIQAMPIKLEELRLKTKSNISWIQASISDSELINNLIKESNFDTIFHMAALLSASAAQNPELAKQINIDASKILIQSAKKQSEFENYKCRFIFPSSIAIYGLNSKTRDQAVDESFKSYPITLYGKQKLEIENFGHSLTVDSNVFDFYALRFPGIISAETIPVGGTSDYASLMAHNAAKRVPYSCFVSASTTLSFIAMPDAVNALITLANKNYSDLHHKIYNLHGFTASAQEIAQYTKQSFPDCAISFAPITEKQVIVESWPSIVDCSAFAGDTSWSIKLNKEDTFFKYLFPKISELYSKGSNSI